MKQAPGMDWTGRSEKLCRCSDRTALPDLWPAKAAGHMTRCSVPRNFPQPVQLHSLRAGRITFPHPSPLRACVSRAQLSVGHPVRVRGPAWRSGGSKELYGARRPTTHILVACTYMWSMMKMLVTIIIYWPVWGTLTKSNTIKLARRVLSLLWEGRRGLQFHHFVLPRDSYETKAATMKRANE